MGLRIVLYTGLLLALFMGGFLLLGALTGYTRRAYAVLPADQTINVAGKTYTLDELARAYQPILKLRADTPSPDLLWVFYEAVAQDGKVDLVYYNVWEDEIHPNPVLHKLYWLFRAAYYGYPVRDIEFIQVSINSKTGDVTGLLFETSPNEDYFPQISIHWIARYTLRPDGLFDVVFTDTSGNEKLRQTSVKVDFEGTRPYFGVATWNHLSRLILKSDAAYPYTYGAAVRYLTDGEYSSYKFVRKSQSDHKTQEKISLKGLSIVFLALFVYIPGILIFRIFFRYWDGKRGISHERKPED